MRYLPALYNSFAQGGSDPFLRGSYTSAVGSSFSVSAPIAYTCYGKRHVRPQTETVQLCPTSSSQELTARANGSSCCLCACEEREQRCCSRAQHWIERGARKLFTGLVGGADTGRGFFFLSQMLHPKFILQPLLMINKLTLHLEKAFI